MRSRSVSRLLRALGVTAATVALWHAAAHAAPDDDFARGRLAWQRGDVTGAMSALRAPAKAGHVPSQLLLAHILEGADFAQEAAQLYRDAAAQDSPDGHAGLASLHLAGRGVAKDEKLALQHFSKAAELGHPLSIEVIANAWVKGQLGLDAAADPAAAKAALLRAAERQHLASADALAQGYQSGRYGLPVDAAEAARWRERAAAWRRERAASAPGGGTRR